MAEFAQRCLNNGSQVDQVGYVDHEPDPDGTLYTRSHIVAYNAENEALWCGWISWPGGQPLRAIDNFAQRLRHRAVSTGT